MSPPGHQLRPIGHHASLAGSATGLELLPGFRFLRTYIEQCRLRRSVLAAVRPISSTRLPAGFSCFRWFAALNLLPLSLLPCMFLLAFCKCRSPSRHIMSPFLCLCRAMSCECSPAHYSKTLPARFARLPWMAAMVVAPSRRLRHQNAGRRLPTTPRGPIGLWLGLVDGQRSSAQVGPLRAAIALSASLALSFRRNPNHGAAPYPIGYECDFFDRAMCFEDTSRLGFSCTVGQVSNVQFFIVIPLIKSSRLVGSQVSFRARLSGSRGGKAAQGLSTSQ